VVDDRVDVALPRSSCRSSATVAERVAVAASSRNPAPTSPITHTIDTRTETSPSRQTTSTFACHPQHQASDAEIPGDEKSLEKETLRAEMPHRISMRQRQELWRGTRTEIDNGQRRAMQPILAKCSLR